jgi:hypothetical protein
MYQLAILKMSLIVQVPGRAMARNAKSFYSHDPTGFETYLRKVALG